MKAHPKYLRCIGVSCLYIAAKTVEEDEVCLRLLFLLSLLLLDQVIQKEAAKSHWQIFLKNMTGMSR